MVEEVLVPVTTTLPVVLSTAMALMTLFPSPNAAAAWLMDVPVGSIIEKYGVVVMPPWTYAAPDPLMASALPPWKYVE